MSHRIELTHDFAPTLSGALDQTTEHQCYVAGTLNAILVFG